MQRGDCFTLSGLAMTQRAGEIFLPAVANYQSKEHSILLCLYEEPIYADEAIPAQVEGSFLVQNALQIIDLADALIEYYALTMTRKEITSIYRINNLYILCQDSRTQSRCEDHPPETLLS